MYVMLVLLELNHIEVNLSDKDVILLGLEVASGRMNDRQSRDFLLARVR